MRSKISVAALIGAALVLCVPVRWRAAAQGAAPSLRASVSRSQITLADTIEYKVELSGGSMGGGVRPEFPDFSASGFDILSGPSTEQHVVMEGFQTRTSLIYSFVLRPRKLGTFRIGPARFTLPDGRTLVSNAVTVRVAKEAAAPAPLPPELKGGNVLWARTGDSAIDRQLRGRLFLRASIDKKQAYVGEQVTLRYDLYQAENLSVESYGLESRPNPYRNFMVETIYQPPGGRLEFRSQVVGGMVFKVAPIESVALFATKSGLTTIPAFVMTADIPVRTRSPHGRRSVFDDPFFNDPFFSDPFADLGFPSLNRRTVRARLVAPPITVNILPLPTEGRPPDFSGTVGDYTMKASFDRTEVKQHDLVGLKIEFTGKGLVDAVSPPELPQVAGLELFKQESNTQPRHFGREVGGTKTFEFYLRPTKAGRIVFPALEYVVFNPRTARYERLKTEPLTLKVLPAASAEKPVVRIYSSQPGGAPAESHSPVVEINRDIEYIRTTGFLRHSLAAEPLYENPFFLFLQIIPVAVVLVSYEIRRRRDKLEGDVALARRRAARSAAWKRLRGARKFLSADGAEKFFEELDRALRRFVADHINESPAGLTTDRIKEALEERGVDETDVGEMVALLEACESARYAKTPADESEMRETFARASHLLDRLSRRLK